MSVLIQLLLTVLPSLLPLLLKFIEEILKKDVAKMTGPQILAVAKSRAFKDWLAKQK